MHGLGCWFTISFDGSAASVVLSTSPGSPGTHWYQCRLLLPEPIAVNRGQVVSGVLVFDANEHFSYDLTLTARLEGTAIACTSTIRLQDQVWDLDAKRGGGGGGEGEGGP
jgi:type I protein arginine methyltransferase